MPLVLVEAAMEKRRPSMALVLVGRLDCDLRSQSYPRCQ